MSTSQHSELVERIEFGLVPLDRHPDAVAALQSLVEQLEAAQEQLAAPRDVTALRVGIDWHSHDGMVTVYDRDGRYLGCMGRESWDWLLEQGYEKFRASVEQLEALVTLVRIGFLVTVNGESGRTDVVNDPELRKILFTILQAPDTAAAISAVASSPASEPEGA